MRMIIPAQVKFADLIDTLCRSVPYVDASEISRFDINRLSRALGDMNAKLTEYENTPKPSVNDYLNKQASFSQ